MASDRFPNLLAARLTMSAANTLTFLELQTGAALGLSLGLMIDRVDYFPTTGSLQELIANTDYFQMGIATSNSLTDTTVITDARIISNKRLVPVLAGVAANVQLFQEPFVESYDPPLILASPKIYLFGFSAGFAAAGTFDCRIYFRYLKLTTQEYLELAEANLLLG